jgi:hypothetical protein
VKKTPPVPRKTLNKRIAAAPTFAQKWEAAIFGGRAPTPIEALAFEAASVRRPSAHGHEWQKEAINRLKAKFTELLFPALMKDDSGPFEELMEASEGCRQARGNIISYLRGSTSIRKESGRKLRQALLTMEPEDRESIRTVMARLEKLKVEFNEERTVRRAMKELKVPLLTPGHICQWIIGNKIIRQLRVEADGTLVNEGMSRKALDDLASRIGWEGRTVQYREGIQRSRSDK